MLCSREFAYRYGCYFMFSGFFGFTKKLRNATTQP
jgi:hypothetical protein